MTASRADSDCCHGPGVAASALARGCAHVFVPFSRCCRWGLSGRGRVALPPGSGARPGVGLHRTGGRFCPAPLLALAAAVGLLALGGEVLVKDLLHVALGDLQALAVEGRGELARGGAGSPRSAHRRRSAVLFVEFGKVPNWASARGRLVPRPGPGHSPTWWRGRARRRCTAAARSSA